MPSPTFVALCALGAMCLFAPVAAAQTAVTYQGRFDEAGSPYSGLLDVSFTVFDDPVAGNQIGPVTFRSGVEVIDGVFTTDFVYDRDGTAESPRFLEVQVRPENEPDFLTLSPRSPIRPAPEAGQTRAARLQPNGDTELGPEGLIVSVDAYNTFDTGQGTRSSELVHIQRFVSNATGPVQEVLGAFNTLPGAAINIETDIFDVATGELVASGVIRNTTSTESSLPITLASAMLLRDSEYELVIRAFDNSTRQPVVMSIDVDDTNADPEGSYNGSATEDLFGRIVVAENDGSVLVTAGGTVIAPNKLVVGPEGGQDGAVILPEGSVNPEEMFAEPGVEFSGPDPDLLDDELARAVLLAPADGYVHAIATADTQTNSDITTINTAVRLDLVEDMLGILDSSTISLQSNGRATLQAVIPVEQGQTAAVSLFKITEMLGGNADNGRLTLVFYPTRYPASP